MTDHDSYLAKQRRRFMVTIFKNKIEDQMVDESDNETKGDEFMKETLPFEDDEVNSESETREEPALNEKPLFDGLSTLHLDSFADVTLVN